MSRRPSCSTGRRRRSRSRGDDVTDGAHLVDAMLGVVVPHGALEDAGGSLAVPPRHPFRVLEDVAQHFAGAGGG